MATGYVGTQSNDNIVAIRVNDGPNTGSAPSTRGNGNGQIHVHAGDGADTIELGFRDITHSTNGHHVRGDAGSGDQDAGAQSADTFNFTGISEIGARAIVFGRFEDFDDSRDTILIEGRELDLSNPKAFSHPDVQSVRVV